MRDNNQKQTDSQIQREKKQTTVVTRGEKKRGKGKIMGGA